MSRSAQSFQFLCKSPQKQAKTQLQRWVSKRKRDTHTQTQACEKRADWFLGCPASYSLRMSVSPSVSAYASAYASPTAAVRSFQFSSICFHLTRWVGNEGYRGRERVTQLRHRSQQITHSQNCCFSLLKQAIFDGEKEREKQGNETKWEKNLTVINSVGNFDYSKLICWVYRKWSEYLNMLSFIKDILFIKCWNQAPDFF